MVYFLIIFFILFTFVSVKKMEWSIWLILFLLPTYQIRFSIFGIPSTLLEIMILISFSVWFVKNYKTIIDNIRHRLKNRSKNQNLKLNRYPFDVEIILVLVVAFTSIIVAGLSNSSFGIFKAYIFEPLLFYILLFNTVFQKKDISKMIWPLAMSALVVSLVAVFQKFGLVQAPDNFLSRVTGVFEYPNALGLYLGPVILLAVGSLISNFTRQASTSKFQTSNQFKIFKLIFVSLSIILSLLALLFASSEGAIVGVIAAMLILFVVFISLKIKCLKFLPIIMTGLIFLFVLLSPLFFLKVVPEYSYPDFSNVTVNKIYDKLTLKDFSGEVRKQQWRETFVMMKDEGQWFWGVGFSGYQEAVKPYHQEGIFFNFERDKDFRRKIVIYDDEYRAKHWQPVEIYMYPHNLFLNFWVELGLLGVFLFVWIFGKMLYFLISNIQHLKSNNQYLGLSLLGVFIVMLVHGIVDVPFFKNDLAVMFWVFVAMVGVFKSNIDYNIN